MKKIVTVVGARPQFVKAAMVSRLLCKDLRIKEVIIHTGQHYDDNMSKIFFDDLDIPPISYQLGVGSSSQGKQTGEMIAAIETTLLQENPDWILIYGDTNSTLAAALAAAKLHIPIAHVEAGLRSYNRKMPEEINRLVADQLSDVLFTPTELAVINLKTEGFNDSRIIEVGDVMYDAALFFADKAGKKSRILQQLDIKDNEYILATIHRAENTNNKDRLLRIFTALEHVSATLPIVMPLHPRTRKIMEEYEPNFLKNTHIRMIDPIGFLDMIKLEKNAALIITDSGGVQKEAFFYQVPCVTLRDETEWVETVQLGWNKLVAVNAVNEIHDHILLSLGTAGLKDQFPYGKGDAAHRIVSYFQGEI